MMVGSVGPAIGLIVTITICAAVLMIVGTACVQVIRKQRPRRPVPPVTLRATADDVRSYPQKDEDE